MSINTYLARIKKVNEELVTINSFHKFKDMSGKKGKICKCNHHKITPTISCNPNNTRDLLRCACQPRPTFCLCSQIVDQSLAQSSHSSKEKSDINELDNPLGNKTEKPTERVEKSEETTVAIQTTQFGDKSQVTDFDELDGEQEKNIEQMYKDLANEKKRNRELEEKLEKITCSIKCLKDEGDQQANCLKDSLEIAQNQAKLAARSRNLAMDLAKQSRDQTDAVKASRDEIIKDINVVKDENSKLKCECDSLRSQLDTISKNEAKKCAEVDDKVNRIKCAVKQKEMALASEKCELEETVAELTNLLKVQKKRICELTSICTKQRSTLQNKENCMASKIAQLSESENKVQSMSCKCKKLQDEIDNLKCCLKNETEARKKLQEEADERGDNCNCEMQIKDKIIADQVETIKKLKKLLQDSERMANQAACEFESIRGELHCLKQSNKSLRAALEEAEAQIASDECASENCERCRILEDQVNNLAEQKCKALAAAKFAAEKLCKTSAEYQRMLDCEKKQHRFVADLVHDKDAEIELLKREIIHRKTFRCQRPDDYFHQ